MLLQAIGLFIVLITKGTDSSFCKYHVCLTWKLSEQLLNLRCRVNMLLFRVEFKNQFNETVGGCIPGHKCYNYNHNVAIKQNIATNVTTCLITGTIDDHLNGKWKCIHGTNTGLADVEVTVLRNAVDGDQNCGAMFWSMVGYIAAIALWIAILSVCPIKVNIVEGIWKKIYDYRCTKYDVRRNPRPISVCKGVLFCVLTTSVIVIVWSISNSKEMTCEHKYYALCILAPICGIIVAVFCISNEDAKELKTTNKHDAKETENSNEDDETREKLTVTDSTA